MQVTTDLILATMKEWVENKHPIAPSTWVDAAWKINLLMGDETDKLYELESQIAKNKAKLLADTGLTVARADTIIRASDEYKEYRKQDAKVKQIIEFIKIAKKQASLRDTEMSGY